MRTMGSSGFSVVMDAIRVVFVHEPFQGRSGRREIEDVEGAGYAFECPSLRSARPAAPRKVGYYLTHANQAKQDLSAARWKIGFLKRLAPLPLPYDRLYAKMKK